MPRCIIRSAIGPYNYTHHVQRTTHEPSAMPRCIIRSAIGPYNYTHHIQKTTHAPSAMPRCTIRSAIEPYIYIHAHTDIVTSIQARSRHYLQIPFKECDQQPFTQELLQYYYTRLTVHTRTPSLNFYRPDLFLTPNQQCHSTEGKYSLTRWTKPLPLLKLWLQQVTLNTGLNFTSLAAVGHSLRHSVCLSRLCLL